MTVVFGLEWGGKVREAKKRGDRLEVETSRRETIFAAQVARLTAASEAAEAAAVRFVRDHENAMVAAARQRRPKKP